MSTPLKLVLVVFIAVGAFLAGSLAHRPALETRNSSRRVLKWICPMHPSYTSDRPGDAPCCGMRLEPVYADDGERSAQVASIPGAVDVGASQQQSMGVQIAEVRRDSASRRLRVPGRVTPDEGRLYRIITTVDGWIVKLGDNPAGTFVKKNEMIACYYTPNLLNAQQSLLYSMRSTDTSRSQVMIGPQLSAGNLGLQVATDSLRSLGMTDVQMESVRKSGAFAPEIHVYSPVDGVVIARNVSPAQRFDKGAELYRIADLRRVWVIADIFEKDRGFLRPGGRAVVRYQGRTFQARMSNALPQFDSLSRTLKTRFELDNPDYLLSQDMFVDVELNVDMPSAVAIPPEAILDSGRSKIVFVERGKGVFEPRPVETGWRLDDRVEVTRGLEPGERIVVSGTFLIDSESRMRLTPASTVTVAEKDAAGKDPVCGMDVDPKNPKTLKTVHGGRTYYFCSDQCKRSFEASPRKYVPKDTKGAKHSAHDAQEGRTPA